MITQVMPYNSTYISTVGIVRSSGGGGKAPAGDLFAAVAASLVLAAGVGLPAVVLAAVGWGVGVRLVLVEAREVAEPIVQDGICL